MLQALKALAKQDFPFHRFEVVVVDDGSTDGTKDLILSMEYPFKLVYEYQENSGPARARNRGVELAQGKYILFIDDDIIATPQLLSEHMATHSSFPKSVVRGPVKHVGTFENLHLYENQFKLEDISTAFFLTGNSSVEKRYIEEAGMFEEGFKEYGWEDLEMGHRLRKMGLKMRYNKRAIGFHYKRGWRKSDLPSFMRQARAKARNALFFLKKHPEWRVRLSTGIHPARLFINELAQRMGFSRDFCLKVIENHPTEELTGFSLLCAKHLYKFEYYNLISEEFKKLR